MDRVVRTTVCQETDRPECQPEDQIRSLSVSEFPWKCVRQLKTGWSKPKIARPALNPRVDGKTQPTLWPSAGRGSKPSLVDAASEPDLVPRHSINSGILMPLQPLNPAACKVWLPQDFFRS